MNMINNNFLKSGLICALLSGLLSITPLSSVFAQEDNMPPPIIAKQTATYGSKAAYTSNFAPTTLTFGSKYLGNYIKAPLQAVEILHFAQTPAAVFEWVTSGNDQWSTSIERLTWDHANSVTKGSLGKGSVRQCDFINDMGTAYERVYAVTENELFAYDLDMEKSNVPLPIKDFFVIWTLEDKGKDGTLVVARIYYHEASDMGGKAAFGVAQSLSNDFRNFANVFNGTYISM